MNEIEMVDGRLVVVSDQEQNLRNSRYAAELERQAAEAAALAAKLAKRPLRSQINATLAAIDGASTIPALRAAVSSLAAMMRDILEVQEVPVVEDVE